MKQTAFFINFKARLMKQITEFFFLEGESQTLKILSQEGITIK